jgi:hypothetical protein
MTINMFVIPGIYIYIFWTYSYSVFGVTSIQNQSQQEYDEILKISAGG